MRCDTAFHCLQSVWFAGRTQSRQCGSCVPRQKLAVQPCIGAQNIWLAPSQVRKGKGIEADKRALAKEVETLRAQLAGSAAGPADAPADDTTLRSAVEAARREGFEAATEQQEARARDLSDRLAAAEARAAETDEQRRVAENAAAAAESRAAGAHDQAQRFQRDLEALQAALAEARAAAEAAAGRERDDGVAAADTSRLQEELAEAQAQRDSAEGARRKAEGLAAEREAQLAEQHGKTGGCSTAASMSSADEHWQM